MEALAEIADSAPAVISNLERGTRNPSRDMVERLAGALPSLDADEYTARHLLNAGLKAAGFMPVDDEHDEPEVFDYLRGKPADMQAEALDLLKKFFRDDDAKHAVRTHGKRAE